MSTFIGNTPPTLDQVCAAIDKISEGLKLPGRGKAGTATASRGNIGGDKKPWAAPSIELYRALLDELPNDQGHFDDRNEFASVIHALKGAAVAGGIEDEGKLAALDWASRWNGGADPDHDERLWDGIRQPSAGWGYLMRTVERVNPAGADRIKTDSARQAYAQAALQNQQMVASAQIGPLQPFLPGQIPPRGWLYGRSVVKGFLSALVSPGGAGKSALEMVEAVAMVTGRELLAGEKPIRPLTVWSHNAEDPMDEQLRRLAAVMKKYGVTHKDLGNRLILTSGRELPLCLARMGKDGPEIVPGVVDSIVKMALRLRVEVFILDPLGAMHSLPENSNEAMNLLAGALREIADRTGAAIIILHHTSKAAGMDMDAAGAGASRGASAIVDAMRIVRQVVRMTSKEASNCAVSERDRRSYMRVENGKANLAPAEDARWLRLSSVPLGNATPEYPFGDEVVVVERWSPPAARPATATDLAAVQAAIAAAATQPRLDAKSPDWVGWLVADTLGLDAGGSAVPAKARSPAQAANFTRVRALVDGWLSGGSLLRVEGRDRKRNLVQCVGIGTPAVLMDLEPVVDPA